MRKNFLQNDKFTFFEKRMVFLNSAPKGVSEGDVENISTLEAKHIDTFKEAKALLEKGWNKSLNFIQNLSLSNDQKDAHSTSIDNAWDKALAQLKVIRDGGAGYWKTTPFRDTIKANYQKLRSIQARARQQVQENKRKSEALKQQDIQALKDETEGYNPKHFLVDQDNPFKFLVNSNTPPATALFRVITRGRTIQIRKKNGDEITAVYEDKTNKFYDKATGKYAAIYKGDTIDATFKITPITKEFKNLINNPITVSGGMTSSRILTSQRRVARAKKRRNPGKLTGSGKLGKVKLADVYDAKGNKVTTKKAKPKKSVAKKPTKLAKKPKVKEVKPSAAEQMATKVEGKLNKELSQSRYLREQFSILAQSDIPTATVPKVLRNIFQSTLEGIAPKDFTGITVLAVNLPKFGIQGPLTVRIEKGKITGISRSNINTMVTSMRAKEKQNQTVATLKEMKKNLSTICSNWATAPKQTALQLQKLLEMSRKGLVTLTDNQHNQTKAYFRLAYGMYKKDYKQIIAAQKSAAKRYGIKISLPPRALALKTTPQKVAQKPKEKKTTTPKKKTKVAAKPKRTATQKAESTKVKPQALTDMRKVLAGTPFQVNGQREIFIKEKSRTYGIKPSKGSTFIKITPHTEPNSFVMHSREADGKIKKETVVLTAQGIKVDRKLVLKITPSTDTLQQLQTRSEKNIMQAANSKQVQDFLRSKNVAGATAASMGSAKGIVKPKIPFKLKSKINSIGIVKVQFQHQDGSIKTGVLHCWKGASHLSGPATSAQFAKRIMEAYTKGVASQERPKPRQKQREMVAQRKQKNSETLKKIVKDTPGLTLKNQNGRIKLRLKAKGKIATASIENYIFFKKPQTFKQRVNAKISEMRSSIEFRLRKKELQPYMKLGTLDVQPLTPNGVKAMIKEKYKIKPGQYVLSFGDKRRRARFKVEITKDKQIKILNFIRYS